MTNPGILRILEYIRASANYIFIVCRCSFFADMERENTDNKKKERYYPMKHLDWKELGIDILVDLAAGLLIAVGVYNFALNADFPVAICTMKHKLYERFEQKSGIFWRKIDKRAPGA